MRKAGDLAQNWYRYNINFENGKDGYVNIKPQMQVYESKLYFLIDLLYEEGNLDWADNGILWVDSNTLEAAAIELELDTATTTIQSFQIHDDVVEVVAYGATQSEESMIFPLRD